MASLNKVILIGNLGRDPESRTFPSGDKIVNATIATTETWKDKQSGEKREATEWHRLVFRGGLADVVEKYLRKGSQIYVEGQIRTRKYNDKDGVERYATDIDVKEMKMLGGKPAGDAGGGGQQQRSSAPAPAPQQRQQTASKPQGGGFDDMDDDIPF